MTPRTMKISGIAALAAVIAAVVVAVGGHSSSSSASATATRARALAGGPSAQGPTGQQGGTPPGVGTEVTGDAAAKVKAAALAKYPGRIEHVVQTPDGSYVAHVITSSGEVHVLVSKDYKVTGTDQRGPGGPGGAPPSGAPTAPSAAGTQI